jgi:hypothetical protein
MRTPITDYFDVQSHLEMERATGLKWIGRHPLGLFATYDFYECQECHTSYPVINECVGRPQANGRYLPRCLCKEEKSI